ncbi:hypothetical protein GIB67_012111 [Kingdonia uniflora]|uniref:Uncharacterized protein n=1 Tax=Kingdonia uniflora TaxID=39325 RepID=A0A7J7LI58_9MAGN|nr:hypothetical protein GIB67_012111 [Kingdonia uniflora]
MVKYVMTDAERDVLQTCKSKAVRDFTISALAASGVVWAATHGLANGYRINLTGGAAAFAGMWKFDRSLSSSLDRILAMNGTRMQLMLANLILTSHQNDAWKLQLMKKHFFSEKFFEDSSIDKPTSRWHLGNIYRDEDVRRQSTYDNDDTHGDNTNAEPKKVVESKQVIVSPVSEVTTDPFECIFGNPKAPEVIRQKADSTSILPNRRTPSRRRGLRRRKDRQVESDTTPELIS